MVHNDPIFGDPKGYKMQCGLSESDKCKTNNDCSSYNCEKYNNKNICGYPSDSGCHSTCDFGKIFFMMFFIPIAIIVILLICCVCCCCSKTKK